MTATMSVHAQKLLAGPKQSKFRRDIQGLRALAVILVILDHLIGWPSGGFVGVDVFFVISGFLITGLLLREYEKTGSISFTSFYRNRIRRIAPAATLVLAVSVLAAALVFNSGRLLSTVQDSLWAFLFAANWHYAVAGTDYFQSSGPESPLQHFWSLAVEEQFYFVWPWLMLAVLVTAVRYFRWGPMQARQAAGVVLAVFVTISFMWALWETENNRKLAYFSTFSRAWELGVGAFIAVFAGACQKLPERVRQPLAYIGLAGIGASVFLISETAAFPGPWAALPVLATAMVLVAGTGAKNVNNASSDESHSGLYRQYLLFPVPLALPSYRYLYLGCRELSTRSRPLRGNIFFSGGVLVPLS